MKMKIHSMSGCQLLLLFCAFLTIFLSTVAIGAIGPSVLTKIQPNPVQNMNQGKKWVAIVNGLSKLNQQIYVNMVVDNVEYLDHGLNKHILIDIAISTTEDGTNFTEIEGSPFTHNRTLLCEKDVLECDSVVIAHEPYIGYYGYMFNITILNPEPFIGNVSFGINYINDKFTLFELWFRFFFLVATFVFIIVFSVKIRTIKNEWNVEQKWTTVLLFGLIAYNNPLFPLEIIVDGWLFPFLDILFWASFIFLCLLYILVVFDSMRIDDSEISVKFFYLPKIILVGILWLGLVVVLSWQEFHELDDPTDVGQFSGFIFFTIAMIAALLLYCFWIIYAILSACHIDDSKPFLKRRLRFFTALTLLVISIFTGGILFDYYGPIENNAAEFLSFQSLMNLYIFTLGMVYLPATSQFSGHYDEEMDLEEEYVTNKENALRAISLDTQSSSSYSY
eukprot:TRINITY_DN6597_c1_g1_i1.p1 TRINITY_DN6597_c1_g1~~TRINITY_DN6597_c1_g1_i1.p1  ORF type:complete len:466 (-),score=68.70 TRINITY_DN6597_c1_g1_i1:29-1372(-)